ncbi:MAG: NAD(P)H-hydrate epimerase [Planctomycetes bacterium RBG_16_59_8]|nr:MAG: NAD(P)H-hydrate epimerase [Planctomycetes bacterium RBG_16_59_8]
MAQRHVTRAEMVEIDRRATESDGIPVLTLMENAGLAVADRVERLRKVSGGGVLVVCGKGNNGGDGFVCARLLQQRGIPVTVVLAAERSSIDPASPAGVNLAAISVTDATRLRQLLDETGIVVDALFGTGLSRPPEGAALEAIRTINEAGKPVVAIDIPSGLDGDTGEPLGEAIRATVTVTMGFPKIGFRNPAARAFTGEIVVADIYRK